MRDCSGYIQKAERTSLKVTKCLLYGYIIAVAFYSLKPFLILAINGFILDAPVALEFPVKADYNFGIIPSPGYLISYCVQIYTCFIGIASTVSHALDLIKLL